MTPDQYIRQYINSLPPHAESFEAVVNLRPKHYYARRDTTDPLPLNTLMEHGVLCGHEDSRRELIRRVRHLDTDVADLKQQLHQQRDLVDAHKKMLDWEKREQRRISAMLTDAMKRHDREVKEARRIIEHFKAEDELIKQSTSWRITGPLRSTAQFMRNRVREARNIKHTLRHLHSRMGIARHIVATEGVNALMKRLRDRATQRRLHPTRPRADYHLEQQIEALVVPGSETPRISIIIPVYEQHLHTYSCLKSITEHAQSNGDLPFEVIVIDDCSPTPAEAALNGVTGARFVRNDVNLGFVRNCNKAAALARGEYLVFLNNDTLVTAGWLKALHTLFVQQQDVGVVGAKLIYPNGTLQEAGGIFWSDGSAWNYGRGDDPTKPEYNYVREVDYCSGACLMVSRKVWDAVGGFDERFAPAYCEDADLCFAAGKLGFRVFYQPASEIIHFEGVSHGTDETSGVKAHQVTNLRAFAEKWRSALASHRPNGVWPELERDRGVEKRVLYIDANVPKPDQDSGSVRASRLLALMRQMGHKVTFIPDNLEYVEPYVRNLQQAGVEVQFWPMLASVSDHLERLGFQYDVIILARYYVAAKHIDDVRRYAPQALLAIDTIDLHFMRQRRLAALEDNKTLHAEAERTYQAEVAAIKACDAAIVVSPIETSVLSEHVPGKDVLVISNIHDVAGTKTSFEQRSGIMFVGSYQHPPNADAVLWYAKEIHPFVQARLPGIVTYIIGSKPPASFAALASETLKVVGFVPEVEPFFEKCRLSIAPLRYGAGVKGKINQSMSHGVPVVSTQAGVEGMHLAHEQEVLVADTAGAFADAIVRTYTDKVLWQTLSQGGMANVQKHFSSNTARHAIENLFSLADLRNKMA